ncbi:MAG: hypothetical protein QF473_32495 [Planctomycetota bacterium]|jgi:hypothetical protein|nr:hypothetical protein [Planctomycetota bacterium]
MIDGNEWWMLAVPTSYELRMLRILDAGSAGCSVILDAGITGAVVMADVDQDTHLSTALIPQTV